jgi:hypothetical protein
VRVAVLGLLLGHTAWSDALLTLGKTCSLAIQLGQDRSPAAKKDTLALCISLGKETKQS